MKSNEKKQAVNKAAIPDTVDPDTELIPPDDESDAVDVLLHRILHRDNYDYESARMSRRDAEEDEFIDMQDLHIVMEDLQFGHDLRL